MAEENTGAAPKAASLEKSGKMVSLADANKALNADVAAKYKVVLWEKRTTIKVYHTKYGVINLKKISLKKVEALMKAKCPVFEKK